MIESHFADLVEVTNTVTACRLLGKSRATHYRRLNPPAPGPAMPRPAPPNKLTETERTHIMDVLNSREYRDLAPAQV